MSTPVPRLRRPPVVRQRDETDCGPAALLSVLRYWNGDSPLVRVRELAGTDTLGTTLATLAEAARTLGFRCRGARGEYEDLAREPMPCIAHVRLPDGLEHYVVVYRIDADEVLLGDPAEGLRTVAADEFRELWQDGVALLLEPTERLVREEESGRLRWLIRRLRPDETWLAQSVFLGIVYTLLGLATALFVQAIIDRFIPRGEYDLVYMAGAALVALQLLRAGVGFVRHDFLLQMNERFSGRMIADFLTHLFRLPSGFFDARQTGDITSRVEDTVIVQSAVGMVVGSAVTDLVVVVGSVGLLFFVAPSLGWLALAGIPAYTLLLAATIRPVREQQRRVLDAYARFRASTIDTLTGIDAVRSFNAAPDHARRNADLNRAFQRRVKKLGRVRARVVVLAELGGALLVVLLLMVGARLVIAGDLMLGEVVAGYALLAGALPSIHRLAELGVEVERAGAASRRMFDVLLTEVESAEGPAGFALERAISIRSGSFAWPRGGMLFRDLDLEIERGRLTGLWGPSGTGKTTLIRILARARPLDAGELLLDGRSAEDVALDDYRRNVVVVPEQVKVFTGTLGDNILMGRSEDGLGGLVDRIRDLGLGPYLDRLPRGLETPIGESGRRLSSGERQVLALMRALLDEPAALLVDEATSTMDAETSEVVREFLRRYAEDHVVLLVSHDLEELMSCETLLVLGEGRIVAAGPPSRVRERCLRRAAPHVHTASSA